MTTMSVPSEDRLPAFLPTAPSPPASTTSSQADVATTMAHLNVNAVKSPPRVHPLPPRPTAVYDTKGDCIEPYQGLPIGPPPWAFAPSQFFTVPPLPYGPDTLGLMGHHVPLQVSPPPGPTFPRPHPFLHQPVIYISFVPSSMTADDFEQPLKRQGVTAALIRLPEAVMPVERLYPDSYYNWMTKNGCLQFETLDDAEKALAVLVKHPFFASKNVLFSPLPPPNCNPLPPAPVAPRFIRPTKFILGEGETNPSPGQVWDFAHAWGSIRDITMTLEESQVPGVQPGHGEWRWRAAVQFWHEVEAQQFEATYPSAGPLMGWEVVVHRDPSYISMTPPPFQLPVMGPPFMLHEQSFSSPSPPQYAVPMEHDHIQEQASQCPLPPSEPAMWPLPQHPTPLYPQAVLSPNGGLTPLSPTSPVPMLHGHMVPTHVSQPGVPDNHHLGLAYVVYPGAFVPATEITPPFASPLNIVAPPSPPDEIIRHEAPWAMHSMAFPVSPPYAQEHLPVDGARPLNESRGNCNQRSGKKRWKQVPGGIVADDGTVIQHSPGQLIQPSPKSGPGSGSHSGLVDYCNLIVKNLAPDVTSHYLRDEFSRFGEVLHVRVMRDHLRRSRCFGFVSFRYPAEASEALQALNAAKFAGRVLSVAYHEPNNPPSRNHMAMRGRGGRRNSSHNGSFMRPEYRRELERLAQAASTSNDAPMSGPHVDSEDTASAPSRLQVDVPHIAPVALSEATIAEKPALEEIVVASPPALVAPAKAATPPPAPPAPVPVVCDDITLESLAVMSPSKIIEVISSGGTVFLGKLGVEPHSAVFVPDHGPQARKIAVVNRVNKLVAQFGSPVHATKRSSLIACIRDFVNDLNDTETIALIELLQYPIIVNAMTMHKLHHRPT